LPTNEVAQCYMKDTCMLYLGGNFYLHSFLTDRNNK
jgi:hypothetical protein